MEQNMAWQSIEPIAPTRMSEARRQAHNALHWLARIAHSYRTPEADDTHVELLWNADTKALRTREFLDDLSVELRLPTLQTQFCEKGVPVPHLLDFEDRTPAHVEAWALVELLHRDIDRDRFSKDLPYPTKDLMLGDSEEHVPAAYEAELAALNGWFCNAWAVLSAVRHDVGREMGEAVKVGEIVCWPQTFQLGMDIPLPQGSGAPSIRTGLSAGDALRPEPFFFVGTKEQTQSGDFDPASILSAKRITTANMSADDVIGFLREQITATRKRLAG